MIYKIISISKLIKCLYFYFFKKKQSPVKPECKTERKVVFLLLERYEGRYIRALIHYFHIHYYKIYLLPKNIKTFLYLALYNSYADLTYKNLRIVFKLPYESKRKESLLFFDYTINEKYTKGWHNTFKINYDIYPANQNLNDTINFPIGILYRHYPYYLRKEPINEAKKLSVLFAGSYSSESYDTFEIKDVFKKHSRSSMVSKLKKYPHFKHIRTVTDFFNIGKIDFLSYVLLVENESTKFRGFSWFDLLDQANFFIAFPGMVAPLTNNITEAMMRGVIPITQYPEYLSPPLQEGINCLVYTDINNFYVKLNEALNMQEKDIKKLRNGVLDYYNNHLSPESFIKKIEDCTRKKNPYSVDMFVEHHSVNLYAKKRGYNVKLHKI